MEELPSTALHILKLMFEGTIMCMLFELALAKVAVTVRGLTRAID